MRFFVSSYARIHTILLYSWEPTQQCKAAGVTMQHWYGSSLLVPYNLRNAKDYFAAALRVYCKISFLYPICPSELPNSKQSIWVAFWRVCLRHAVCKLGSVPIAWIPLDWKTVIRKRKCICRVVGNTLTDGRKQTKFCYALTQCIILLMQIASQARLLFMCWLHGAGLGLVS